MEKSHAKDNTSCAGCMNDIDSNDYVTAQDQVWHRDCFRCSVCDVELTSWYYEKAGLLFCRPDYCEQFGGRCQLCEQQMTTTGTESTCDSCVDHASHGTHDAQCDVTHTTHNDLRTPQAARQVVSAKAVTLPTLLLTPDGGRQIDSSCGFLGLPTVDRHLATDGTPGADGPLRHVDKLITGHNAPVQLTIQQNHDTNAQNPPAPSPCDVTSDITDKIEERIIDNTGGGTIDKMSEETGKRGRLFKRKGDLGGKGRHLKRRQSPASPHWGGKEKSSSMSKLLDAVEVSDGAASSDVRRDLTRARSFRAQVAAASRVFRDNDLLQGELLGSGFFGSVYLVTHRATGELMVLKQLYRLDEDAQRNFLKEVAVLRSLEHPNVLRFIGVLYKDKRLHLVTEYVAGGTLHHLLQDGGVPLPWRRRLSLARDASAGVSYLHRRSVIHRDLNSHNCLVREDMTVVVADFGLARIVQRDVTHAHAHARRKRYTVVGNPYWMAPEMMNGKVYDEKVDVFSFGIILCEIIGRVSADPDVLPRRGDFGLNEASFLTQYCRLPPPPPAALLALAFRACRLDPDHRPSFEEIERWLTSLLRLMDSPPMEGQGEGEKESLLREIQDCPPESGVPIDTVHKSPSLVRVSELGTEKGARLALGKCMSASHISPSVTAGTPLAPSRSHAALSGYILRARGDNIDITRVDDVTRWLDTPPPLKRASPDCDLSMHEKARKMEDDLPAFLRNQSVEGLESASKEQVRVPASFCRHSSVPDGDTDSSDDDLDHWYRGVKDLPSTGNVLANIVKKGENLLTNKASYHVTDPKIDRCEDQKTSKLKANPPAPPHCENRVPSPAKPTEKTNFFKKNLLSPKFSRLFKPNTAEVVRTAPADENREKSKSKFFIQRPASPGNVCRSSYRVRPTEGATNDDKHANVTQCDLKLASLGKPMTPIFRRYVLNNEFADGRFSYRERRPKYEPEVQLNDRRTKTQINDRKFPGTVTAANKQLPPLATLVEKTKGKIIHVTLDPKTAKCDRDACKKRESGISRSNYVSLANLKINNKPKEIEKGVEKKNVAVNRDPASPVERVI